MRSTFLIDTELSLLKGKISFDIEFDGRGDALVILQVGKPDKEVPEELLRTCLGEMRTILLCAEWDLKKVLIGQTRAKKRDLRKCIVEKASIWFLRIRRWSSAE